MKKKIIKYILALFLLSTLLFAFVACGQNFSTLIPNNGESEGSINNGATDNGSMGNNVGNDGTTDGSTDSGNADSDLPDAGIPEIEYAYGYMLVSTVNSLSVRNGAGASYASLGTLDAGDGVAYLGEENGWYKTVYKNKTAYVAKAYCQLKKMLLGDERIEKVVNEGMKLLGFPYTWGSQRYHWGNGNLNTDFVYGLFDCSALTQYAYYMADKTLLDLTTRTQVLQGKAVAKNEIRRGDLLFFTNSSRYYLTGNERVGHVAIYLGDNYVLHTSSDHAVIEPISTARWNYYITARRV